MTVLKCPNKVHQRVQRELSVILTCWIIVSWLSLASQNRAKKVLAHEFVIRKPPKHMCLLLTSSLTTHQFWVSISTHCCPTCLRRVMRIWKRLNLPCRSSRPLLASRLRWAPHNGASLLFIYLLGIDVSCKTVNGKKVWKAVEITLEVRISFVQPILTAVP